MQHGAQKPLQRGREAKGGLDIGGVAAGADGRRVGALAQHQRDRVEDNRLARARLASQHVETGVEFQPQLVNNGEVTDDKFR